MWLHSGVDGVDKMSVFGRCYVVIINVFGVVKLNYRIDCVFCFRKFIVKVFVF